MRKYVPYDGIYCDERMGGYPKYYLGGKPANADMRIPDEYLKGVFFLSVRKTAKSGQAEIDYFIGTGFIVSGPTRFKDMRIFYLVTAKHVLENAKAKGYEGKDIRMRVNTKDGKSITLPVVGPWYYPKNEATDIAVLPTPLFLFPELQLDIYHSPVENFATDEVIEKDGIGIGDDVFAIGLFNQHWGHERNIPIMRTGIVASMPQEPLQTEFGERNAFLIEIRSIGGLSGSPVYVHLDFWRHNPNQPPPTTVDGEYRVRWHMYMFGVISGHWDLERQDSAHELDREEVAAPEIVAATEDEERGKLNTGIAIVTPIQEVLDLINSDQVMAYRKKAERRYLSDLAKPTYDPIAPPRRKKPTRKKRPKK